MLKRNSWEDTGAAEGRLSLSEDWVSHGNFSLTLKQAQKDDQGDYFCYIQDEVVIAVRLTVTSQRSPDQSSSTRPPFLPVSIQECHMYEPGPHDFGKCGNVTGSVQRGS